MELLVFFDWQGYGIDKVDYDNEYDGSDNEHFDLSFQE